jgi:osmotically inducible protein OsmC
MGISKGSAQWTGGFKDGKGTMKPAHAAEAAFTAGSRFEGQPSSNPEELIGAALAGCFSMALTVGLEKAGLKPQGVRTSADVRLERQGEGFAITGIELSTEAQVPGIDAARFQQIAEDTKRGCPVSKALAGTTITLLAKLM